MTDEFEREVRKTPRLGKKERQKEANLAAAMCQAIFTLGAVRRTAQDPNALLRTLNIAPTPCSEGLAEFFEWEAYLLDAKSLLSAIE